MDVKGKTLLDINLKVKSIFQKYLLFNGYRWWPTALRIGKCKVYEVSLWRRSKSSKDDMEIVG